MYAPFAQKMNALTTLHDIDRFKRTHLYLLLDMSPHITTAHAVCECQVRETSRVTASRPHCPSRIPLSACRGPRSDRATNRRAGGTGRKSRPPDGDPPGQTVPRDSEKRHLAPCCPRRRSVKVGDRARLAEACKGVDQAHPVGGWRISEGARACGADQSTILGGHGHARGALSRRLGWRAVRRVGWGAPGSCRA